MSNRIYLVICGAREPYVAERDLKDMGREETIRDLARGEWTYNGNCRVSSIIEVGTDKDVTDEFMAAAGMYLDSLTLADRIDNTRDHSRKLARESV
jgi:hypothetical protein